MALPVKHEGVEMEEASEELGDGLCVGHPGGGWGVVQ
jgi:hypothetical protein